MDIKWTNTAIRENNNNINYLLENWETSVLENYLDNLEKTIRQIKRFPDIGMYDENFKAHKILVVRQIYLFYDIRNNTIFIKSIWNNYRKPIWK